MSFDDPIVGGTVIRIPAMQSPNFSIANGTGWAILQNGDAYFFDVTATGTITGTSIIVDGANGGVFVYSGPPAAGNLIVSLAGMAGTDTYGNSYPEGISVTAGTIAGTKIMGASIMGSTFTGTDFIVNANGVFFYSGTPAAGNLLISLVRTAGSDTFGNVYAQGLTIGSAGSPQVVIGTTGGSPLMYFPTGRTQIMDSSAIQTIIQGTGNSGYEQIQIIGAQDSTQKDLAGSTWLSSSEDGTTQNPQVQDFYMDPTGVFHTFRQMSYAGNATTGPTTAVQPGTGTSRTNVAVAEVWHQVGATGQPAFSSTSWTTGVAPNPPLKFRALADTGGIKIYGYAAYTGTPAAGTDVFTLPSGYYDPTYVFVSSDAWDSHNGAVVAIEVSNAGVVSLQKGAGASANIFFDVTIYPGF